MSKKISKQKEESYINSGTSALSNRAFTIPNILCLIRILLLTPFVNFFLDKDYIWAGKGYCLEEMRRYEEAINCFDMALKIDPDEKFYWLPISDCFEAMGMIDAAEECERRFFDS